MSAKRGEQAAVVNGTPAACFAALVDYESFPSWQRAVKSVEVLSRDGEGRGREVAFQIDARLRTVSYTLSYSYEPPARISWDYVEGDVKHVDGEFLLEDQGDGTTLATYRLRLDPGVWLPGPVMRVLTDQVMKGAVDDLKRRVEGG